MATSKKDADPKLDTGTQDNPWHDTWVRTLTPTSNDLKQTVLLTGFVGPTDKDDAIRVYSDAHLQTAIDVPLRHIVHREAVPRSISPLGGSYLWIDACGWKDCTPYRRTWQHD